jgi:hypothetical protein
MKQAILMILALLIISACGHKKKPQPTVTAVLNVASYETPLGKIKNIADSSITLFDDPAYAFQLHVFDKGSLDQTKPNAILTVKFKQDKKEKVLFKDSLYCMHPVADFKDFNNDKVNDLIIYYYGAHANERYHLYLINPKSHSLVHVKGFEELPNPKLDTKNNIIASNSISDSESYSFHRINKKNGLVNLGHAFESTLDDTTRYRAAIKEIKQDSMAE